MDAGVRNPPTMWGPPYAGAMLLTAGIHVNYNRRRHSAPGKCGTLPLRAQCCSLPASMSIITADAFPFPENAGPSLCGATHMRTVLLG